MKTQKVGADYRNANMEAKPGATRSVGLHDDYSFFSLRN
jgi:hypothetical protein